MNIKDITIPLIVGLLFTESIQNTTQIFPLNHNVGFFRVSTGRWHNAIRVRAKPCVHHLIIPDTPQVPRQAKRL